MIENNENIKLIVQLDSYQKLFNENTSKVFWSYFNLNNNNNSKQKNNSENQDEKNNNIKFINAINELYQSFTKVRNELVSFCISIDIVNKDIWIERLQNMLMSSLIIDRERSKQFNQLLFKFFEFEFVSFSKSYIGSMKQQQNEDEEDDNDNEMIDISLNDSFTDIAIKESMFMEICDKLSQLNFIIVSEDLISEILLSKIHEYIDTKCRGEYERRLLCPILNWADAVIFKWLSMILSKSDPATFEQWKMRIEFSIYEYYSNQRIDELFNMIRLYPDSLPAIEDLALCFQKISIQKQLIESLKRVFHQRLLHPGANTNDIITTYISTIQTMKILDPTCVVMDQVGQPIKTYLANREDTIRCIVSSFTDESNEIYQEFSKGGEESNVNFDQLDIENCDVYLDDADTHMDLKSFDSWQPASLESHPNQKKQKYRDTISSLVNIYESTDLFVNEYRLMLSERLLSMTDFDVDKEIENVELLKLRFGENSMHNCEIMIKDITDSKRLNNQIGQAMKEKKSVDKIKFETLILSGLFWPSMKEEPFKYPASINNQMNAFAKEYEAIKAPRTLQWKQHLGYVELDVEINGQLRSLSVSPLHATIIMLFEQQPKITLSELADQLALKEEHVKRKLAFWINQHVLVEVERGVYEVAKPSSTVSTANSNASDDMDTGGDGGGSGSGGVVVEEEDDQQTASAREKELQLEQVKNYVTGMLTNFGTLPIERIHMMLTMFNSDYSLQQSELKSYLQKLQNDELLEYSGGEYKLKN